MPGGGFVKVKVILTTFSGIGAIGAVGSNTMAGVADKQPMASVVESELLELAPRLPALRHYSTLISVEWQPPSVSILLVVAVQPGKIEVDLLQALSDFVGFIWLNLIDFSAGEECDIGT